MSHEELSQGAVAKITDFSKLNYTRITNYQLKTPSEICLTMKSPKG